MRSHRRDGATVNDVLLAGLGVTIRRWNDRHDATAGPVSVMMPVNLRPAEWRNDVVGNFASYVSVRFTPRDLVDLPAAVSAARARTREIKRRDAAGLVVDLLELPTATLPTAVKRRFQDLITLTGNRFVDTAVLSNLGRLDGVPRLGGSAGDGDAGVVLPAGAHAARRLARRRHLRRRAVPVPALPPRPASTPTAPQTSPPSCATF